MFLSVTASPPYRANGTPNGWLRKKTVFSSENACAGFPLKKQEAEPAEKGSTVFLFYFFRFFRPGARSGVENGPFPKSFSIRSFRPAFCNAAVSCRLYSG